MKKLRKYLMLIGGGLLFLAIAIISYNKNQQTFKLEDFKAVGTVYEENDPAIKENLGKTKEMALVPMNFKTDNTLYNIKDIKEFILIRDGKLPPPKTYYTDLNTFYKVTKLWYATPEYVLPASNGATDPTNYYVFDYLRKPVSYDKYPNKIN